jgi:hypothetical protein
VHDDRVDDQRDQEAVDHVGAELRALRHRPGHDRGRGRREGDLEDEEGGDGEVALPQVVLGDVAADEPAARADEVVARTEREAEAHRGEGEDADREVHHVLHHDVGDVLAPGETRLDQGEPRLHEDHQDRGDQDEDVVQVLLDLRDRVGLLRPRRVGDQRDDRCGDAGTDRQLGSPATQHGCSLRTGPGGGRCRTDPRLCERTGT